MSKLTVHVLEVDTKETSETTTLAVQGGTATVDSSTTFTITETNPTKFGGLEVGKDYDVVFTLSQPKEETVPTTNTVTETLSETVQPPVTGTPVSTTESASVETSPETPATDTAETPKQ